MSDLSALRCTFRRVESDVVEALCELIELECLLGNGNRDIADSSIDRVERRSPDSDTALISMLYTSCWKQS